MPARRKQTALGRAPGKGRDGATLASLEHIEHWCRRAEKAGVDVEEWYREGIEKLHFLAQRPITRSDIDEMGSIEEAMRLGLEEAGNPEEYEGKSLIPAKFKLYDLQWRTAEHRANVLVEWQ
jgi:hypothetical protein